MLRRPTTSKIPDHKSICDRQRYSKTHHLGHKILITCAPDECDEKTDGNVSDAPNTHEGVAEFLGFWLFGDGNQQGIQVSVGTEEGVQAEAENGET